jgi:hypothetical protein
MSGQAQNSAIDALLKTLDRIARDLGKCLNYSKKKPLRTTVLTHDIVGAFKNTHPKLLVQVMHQRQMPQYLTDWATAFTSDKTLSFCFDGLKETPKPSQGWPTTRIPRFTNSVSNIFKCNYELNHTYEQSLRIGVYLY